MSGICLLIAPVPVHCFSITFIQVLMHVLVTCKNEEDPIKNEFARVATTFLPWEIFESLKGS